MNNYQILYHGRMHNATFSAFLFQRIQIRCVWSCHGQLKLDKESKEEWIWKTCIVHWLSEAMVGPHRHNQLMPKSYLGCRSTTLWIGKKSIHCDWLHLILAILLITPMFSAIAKSTIRSFNGQKRFMNSSVTLAKFNYPKEAALSHEKCDHNSKYWH